MTKILPCLPQAVVIAFCALALALLPAGGGTGFGATTLPRFLLWSIAALAAADLVVALLKAPPETVGGANPLLPVAGTVVVLLAAAALMPMAGFAVTAVLTFFACGWLMGFRSLGALAVSSVAMALFCWAIFTFAIDLSLPTSPFSRDI